MQIILKNVYLPEFDTFVGQDIVEIEATDRCNGDL